MGFSIPGSGLVKKAIHAGGDVVHAASHLPGKAVDRLDSAKDKAVGGIKDAVHFSGEVLEAGAHQGKNFGRGVVEWGKGTVGTVASLASHPRQTLKAVKSLAENPLLNPSQGIGNPLVLGKDLIQGKNPLDRYKQGARQLEGIGSTLANDYKAQYDKNGAAGLAGYVAPDLVTAVLSGGSTTAAKGGATVAAKATAGEVAEEVVQQGAGSALKDTTTNLVKESVKSQVPDGKTISDAERRNQDDQQNHLEALISNFSLF
ncbi:hypothetical protein JST97_10400 [bacterium]|nr:hypothetical protein [bacterium]